MSEELLTVKVEKISPLKTINKNLNLEKKNLKDLTYTLNLTSDQIFELFSLESNLKKIISLDKKNDSFDNKCPYYKQEGIKHYNQRCKGCQILYRLRKGKIPNSNIIEIFSGINKGVKIKLSIKTFFKEQLIINKLYKLKKDSISKALSNIIQQTEYKSSMFFPILNKNYNYVIQSIIFNKIMENEKTDYRNNYLWSYICGHRLKILEIDNNIKNLDDLINNPIFSISHSPTVKQNETVGISKTSISFIIKQLVIIFKILSEYEYIHGKPDIKYINYSLNSVFFDFDKKYLNFPFKLIIKNSDFTSVTYLKKRYFCTNNTKFKNTSLPFEKISVYINNTKNFISNPNYPDYYNDFRLYGYKIGNQINNFTNLRNFYGVPLCYKSFDFVLFLTSFVIDPNFLYFKDCKEFDIWKGLWAKEELSKLLTELKKIKKNNYENIINILKNYHIRFDAIDYFYNYLYEN